MLLSQHCLNTATSAPCFSLLFGNAILTSLLLKITSTADGTAKYGGRAQDLRKYVTHNVTWYSTSANASFPGP